MGLGTKIKEVLKGDEHQKNVDTSGTPGAYPSERTPRTHEGHATDSGFTSTEHGTKHVPGKTTSDYTYGSTIDQSGHKDHGRSGSPGVIGSAGSQGNKLTKGHKTDPYWGDSDRVEADHIGTHTNTGTHSTARRSLDPQGVNERYHGTSSDNATSGSTEGRYGERSSRLANPTDSRYESDHDHVAATTAMPGSYGDYSGSQGAVGLGGHLHSGSTSTGRDATDRDILGNSRAPGQDYDATRTSHTTTAGGPTSTLTHRSHHTDSSHRDHKIDEYDAPSNSSGRGHGLAGVGAGAAAGYGAAQFADNHREHGLVKSHSPPRGADSGGLIAPHSSRSGAAAVTEPGLLDPYDRNTTSNNGTAGTTGINSSNTGNLGTTGTHGLQSSHGLHSQHGQNIRDSGLSRGDNVSVSSSDLGSSGRDRFGPGHDGARVMHKCHNCGADNDITKHFQKDAVYRIG